MKQKPGAKAHAVVCFDKETVSVSTVLGQMEVNESLQHRACLQGTPAMDQLGTQSSRPDSDFPFRRPQTQKRAAEQSVLHGTSYSSQPCPGNAPGSLAVLSKSLG